jgi:hypothetical protein
MDLARFSSPKFRTVVRRKESTMLIVLGIAAALAAAGAVHAVRETLNRMPRSNRDWIFY